jgi:hypothetical protein
MQTKYSYATVRPHPLVIWVTAIGNITLSACFLFALLPSLLLSEEHWWSRTDATIGRTFGVLLAFIIIAAGGVWAGKRTARNALLCILALVSLLSIGVFYFDALLLVKQYSAVKLLSSKHFWIEFAASVMPAVWFAINCLLLLNRNIRTFFHSQD